MRLAILLFCLQGFAVAAQAASLGEIMASSEPVKPQIRLNTELLLRKPEPSKINEPSDLLNLVPIVRDINRWLPRRFSFVDHEVVLTPGQMEIRHFYLTPRARRIHKQSFIIFGYDEVGQAFNTSLEVPLFYSPQASWEGWEAYPFGNYTMRISQGSNFREEKYFLRARTKF